MNLKRNTVVLLAITFCLLWFITGQSSCSTSGAGLYIKILDTANPPKTTGGSPGADMDFIEVKRGGSHLAYVESVYAANLSLKGGEQSTHTDPNAIMGKQDGKFVALGGDGGFVVTNFGVMLQSGDVLHIHEIGKAESGVDEPWEALIGHSPGGPWTTVGRGAGPVNITIP